LKPDDIGLLKRFFSNQRAKSAVVNSGAVINADLKALLIKLANNGRTYGGGRVEIIDEVLGTFRLIFNKLD